jgi:hypothetical protein
MLLFLLCAGPITAQEPKPETDSKFSLTLYSTADPANFDPRQRDPNTKLPGYAIVRETRRLTLDQGNNTVKFQNVPAQIDPTTVSFKSLTAPDSTSVLEQSFEYDLATPDKLLEKYLGKSIIINRKQEPLPSDRTRMPETIEARLLAFTPDHFVLQTNNKQLPLQIIPRNPDLSEIKLFELQPALTTRPTLVWNLNTEKPGEHDVLVSYQTDNLTWRADYSVTVNNDDTRADLSAWVTLVNESGATYPNAKLKLIAGDVQRLQGPEPHLRAAQTRTAPADAAFAEKSFAEYHLYTLARPTSLPNNSVKQIEFISARPNLAVTKTYVYYGLGADVSLMFPDPATDRDIRFPSSKKVDAYLQLANTEKNNLGIPLPAGRVRVYKRDEDSLEFIGEDKIDHSPKNEQVLIRLGQAFDLTGQRKQTSFNVDESKKTMTESFELKLKSQKQNPVKVIVKEPLFRWSNWEITKSSDKYEKYDARTIHIPVEVPPNSEKTVTYTVRYSW